MPPSSRTSAVPPVRLLTFASGGWVLLTAGVLCAAVFVWWLVGALPRLPTPRGDGIDVATYGFDLTTCLVPRERIVASGLPRDSVPVLSDPQVLTPAELLQLAAELRRGHQGKFLVAGDLVVGIELDGIARAYPLRLLRWHQVVNDTLAGVPIAVTFSPLSDSLVVFERRVGQHAVEFGDSGLVYDAVPLLYDRQAETQTASLWCALQLRAVAGPAAAAGAVLQPLPAAMMSWGEWQARHPQTTVLAPLRSHWRLYKESPNWERLAERVAATVAPSLPADGWAPLTPVIAVRAGHMWHVWSITELVAALGSGEPGDVWVEGISLRMHVLDRPPTAWVEPADEQVPVLYSRWFAWYVHHPDTCVESWTGQ